MTDTRLQLKNIIDSFQSGDFINASDKTLQEWLIFLNTEPNPPREVIQALTIHNLQLLRHINKLNEKTTKLQDQGNKLQKQNNRLQKVVIALMAITILTGFVQIYTGLKPIQQTPTHISQQVAPKFEDSSSMTIEGQSSKTPSKIQKANEK
jgi:hypothetical protein